MVNLQTDPALEITENDYNNYELIEILKNKDTKEMGYLDVLKLPKLTFTKILLILKIFNKASFFIVLDLQF